MATDWRNGFILRYNVGSTTLLTLFAKHPYPGACNRPILAVFFVAVPWLQLIPRWPQKKENDLTCRQSVTSQDSNGERVLVSSLHAKRMEYVVANYIGISAISG